MLRGVHELLRLSSSAGFRDAVSGMRFLLWQLFSAVAARIPPSIGQGQVLEILVRLLVDRAQLVWPGVVFDI